MRICVIKSGVQDGKYTRIVQKVLQMLGFHRYKSFILAKFVMLE